MSYFLFSAPPLYRLAERLLLLVEEEVRRFPRYHCGGQRFAQTSHARDALHCAGVWQIQLAQLQKLLAPYWVLQELGFKKDGKRQRWITQWQIQP